MATDKIVLELQCSECGDTAMLKEIVFDRHGEPIAKIVPCDACVREARSEGYTDGWSEAGGDD